MERGQRLAKIGAVLSSIALVSAYVYDRAGGGLFSHAALPELAPHADSDEARFLPGPKSAPVWSAAEEGAAHVDSGSDSDATEGQSQTASASPAALLPGSKSAVGIIPGTTSYDTLVKGKMPRNAVQPQSGAQDSRRRALLPGSKSKQVFMAVPAPLPAGDPTSPMPEPGDSVWDPFVDEAATAPEAVPDADDPFSP
jgi:hypothetical protein